MKNLRPFSPSSCSKDIAPSAVSVNPHSYPEAEEIPSSPPSPPVLRAGAESRTRLGLIIRRILTSGCQTASAIPSLSCERGRWCRKGNKTLGLLESKVPRSCFYYKCGRYKCGHLRLDVRETATLPVPITMAAANTRIFFMSKVEFSFDDGCVYM